MKVYLAVILQMIHQTGVGEVHSVGYSTNTLEHNLFHRLQSAVFFFKLH